ncbi:DUF6517 family protein [Halegenticoccus tardaugens]|uniref:DUF6517 family protein n=1 Tax=Halegenticoccus tardaugens TaxID=2071624 RepID=UPI00100C0368|nr:DUF6517 family protein [Halegenticoccus tardaugens]
MSVSNRRTTRRRVLAGTAAALSAGLAGCAGSITGDGSVEFAASGAPLPDAALSASGYAEHRVTEDVVTRRYEVFGVGREVDVTNVICEYDRAIDLGAFGRLQGAVFATLSTPKVEVLGRAFNPVADMSTAEIAHTVQERYEAVRNVSPESEFDASVLGTEATVTRFTADARLLDANASVEIYLYVSEAVAAGGDFVVCLAAHPRVMYREGDAVRDLLAAVEHRGASE